MEKTSELIWQDTQHQTLFQLIEEIKSKNSTPDIFAKLFLYADSHFCLEEAYMKQLAYPHMDEHIKAHNKFREELSDMMKEQHGFDENVRISVSVFLREWLTRHVLGIDKNFEAFVLASKYK